jgi:hypothetical protein
MLSLTVPAPEVTTGTIIDARPCFRCGQPISALEAGATERGYRVAMGCACGTFGIATLPVGGVLTLTGTLAILC